MDYTKRLGRVDFLYGSDNQHEELGFTLRAQGKKLVWKKWDVKMREEEKLC